jgi:hypothetical protein
MPIHRDGSCFGGRSTSAQARPTAAATSQVEPPRGPAVRASAGTARGPAAKCTSGSARGSGSKAGLPPAPAWARSRRPPAAFCCAHEAVCPDERGGAAAGATACTSRAAAAPPWHRAGQQRQRAAQGNSRVHCRHRAGQQQMPPAAQQVAELREQGRPHCGLGRTALNTQRGCKHNRGNNSMEQHPSSARL